MDDTENKVINFLFKSTNEDLCETNRYLLDKLTQQNNELEKVLFVDNVTNLNNINKFNIDMEKNIYECIAVYDVKELHNVNNLYGKDIGDNIVRNLALEMHRYAQKNGLVLYRIKSSIIAATPQKPMEDKKFIEIVSNMQEMINKTNYGHNIYINSPMGIVLHEDKILEKAIFMLDYIRDNKKYIEIYSSELRLEENIKENLFWIKKVKKAISSDNIVPYFQPIYNNKIEKYDKFETLIRLCDENGDIFCPGTFLDIAKKAKIYRQLTKIMIDKTFNVFADKNYDFSINLTVDDILDINMRAYIVEKLKIFPNPKNIIFELVETEGIKNFSEVKSFIDEIKLYGAKLAIDDFGTGYSNLLYLAKLDIDILKIDGSIIKKIAYDDSSLFITKTILYLTKSMDIDTVAEYVENKDIYDKIKALGIDYSQGYYFSAPISEDELYKFIN